MKTYKKLPIEVRTIIEMVGIGLISLMLVYLEILK